MTIHSPTSRSGPVGIASTIPRQQIRLLAFMVLAAAIMWLVDPAFVIAPQSYLPLHTVAEIFAVVVAMLVFACAWHAGGARQPGNVVVLGGAFLCVGLLDLGHLLSFHGMPQFVTPSGPEKAINFWLAGRLVEALTLLAVASKTFRPLTSSFRHLMLAASLTLTAVIYWAVLFHPDRLPQTFLPGDGLTSLKVGTEYLIIMLHLAAAATLMRLSARNSEFDTANLFAAAIAMGLSELFFTGYKSVTDLYNLMGHVYKVLAYAFVYRAVFIDSVRRPVQALLAAEEREKQLLQGALVETTTELALTEQRYTFLRELAAHRERIKEEERKRIARDIHDDLGQTLLALRIDMSMFAAKTATSHPRLHGRISTVLNYIDAATKSMRAIINDLRPPVLDLGLVAAITWQAQEFQRRAGIPCKLEVDSDDIDGCLDECQSAALFHVVQESLSNIIRHAQATEVRIAVRTESGILHMTIADNGIGIPTAGRKKQTSFGLAGIEERINALDGQFNVDSALGQGTRLSFSVPIAAVAPASA